MSTNSAAMRERMTPTKAPSRLVIKRISPMNGLNAMVCREETAPAIPSSTEMTTASQ